MDKTNKIYDTYRVNLDNGRLFGITILLLILLFLAFLAGFYAGRILTYKKTVRANREASVPAASSSGTMALFSNLTAGTQLQRYDFYQALPKDRLTREDLERSIPLPEARSAQREDLVQDEPLPVRKPGTSRSMDDRRVVRDNDLRPQRQERPSEHRGTAVKGDRGGKILVQVASHRSMPAAEALENRLKSRSYPVQIVKSRINGTLYFRVRVGPYASRAEAQTVLSRLREKEGFSAAYFCAP
jgi:cell division septation protein DedD